MSDQSFRLESPPRTIRAISLWQPWATLVALGTKRIETRSWGTSYRGALAIHAAKRRPGPAEVGLMAELVGHGMSSERAHRMTQEPVLGAFVGVVHLYDVAEMDETLIATVSHAERAMGNYAPGRFAWRLDDAIMLRRPVPAPGRQRFWSIPEGLLAEAQPE